MNFFFNVVFIIEEKAKRKTNGFAKYGKCHTKISN